MHSFPPRAVFHLDHGIACGNPRIVKPLPPPDSHHLLAAEGWIELGNHVEANQELELISPRRRIHPDVLELRWQIYANARRWDACLDIANKLVQRAPTRAHGWIHRSFTLHQLKRTQEAFDKLRPVANEFPKIWTIPYNLACYCSQLGRLKEAEDWFKKAMHVDDKATQKAGIDDPDLKPLWDSMSTTVWKRLD